MHSSAGREYFFTNNQPLKRNVIFMVSDGFGPTSETFGRSIYQYVANGGHSQLPPYDSPNFVHQLPLDTILVGQSRTRSSDSWVTDSAAGATAFSCLDKSYNGAVGVNSTQAPCATLLEAAKLDGMMTGMVVTSRITHATPGAFSSHVTWRNYENEIAVQQIGNTPIGRSVDLMMGGGRCHFLPKSAAGSCRQDERNLENEALKHDFKRAISSRAEFDKLSGDKNELPLMGLFDLDHMSYNIDRDPSVQPSLYEMANTALKYMTSATEDSEKGFFLLIEGSRIDMAAHDNDAAAHAHEILHYQTVVQLVKEYIDAHPGTVMISVSDHETGGLSLGAQLTTDYPAYEWNPEAVVRVRNSSEITAQMIMSVPSNERSQYVRNVVIPAILGIDDGTNEDVMYLSYKRRTAEEISWYMSRMVTRRSLLSWATHGHSGVDVNLYAYSGQSGQVKDAVDPLRGNHENTEVGAFVKSYLGLQDQHMNDITAKLVLGVVTGTLIMHPADKPSIPMLNNVEGSFVERNNERYHSHQAMGHKIKWS